MNLHALVAFFYGFAWHLAFGCVLHSLPGHGKLLQNVSCWLASCQQHMLGESDSAVAFAGSLESNRISFV